MAQRHPRVQAMREKILTPLTEYCEQCGQMLWVAYHNHRTITTLSGVWRLIVVMRQCMQPACPNFHRLLRPEEEGGWALPHSTFGLDLTLFMGIQHFDNNPYLWLHLPPRFRNPGSPALYQSLMEQDICIAQRSVTNLLHRYKQLVTGPTERIEAKLQQQGRVLLAIDLWQFMPDPRNLVVIRDCLSAEIIIVRCLSTVAELENLLTSTKYYLDQTGISVKGFIFADNQVVHNLIVSLFPGVPYQLLSFRYEDSPESS